MIMCKNNQSMKQSWILCVLIWWKICHFPLKLLGSVHFFQGIQILSKFNADSILTARLQLVWLAFIDQANWPSEGNFTASFLPTWPKPKDKQNCPDAFGPLTDHRQLENNTKQTTMHEQMKCWNEKRFTSPFLIGLMAPRAVNIL